MENNEVNEEVKAQVEAEAETKAKAKKKKEKKPAKEKKAAKEKAVRKKSRAPLVALILIVGIFLRVLVCAGVGTMVVNYYDDQYKKNRAARHTTEEEDPDETTTEETEPTETTVDPNADDWTILVYMCGSNLESRSGIASEFIDWMNDETIADGVNVIVETGGSLAWNNTDPYFSGDSVQNVTIPANGLGRYKVEHDNVIDLGSAPAASMGSARTLSDFISWGASEYPAQKYMFVMWDHGFAEPYGCMEHDEVFYDDGNGGTVNSFDQTVGDDLYNDCLYLDEVRTGFMEGGVHFDLIAFNTCLTASIEVASAVAPYGDYMVASQESIPAAIGIPVQYLSFISEDTSCTGSDVADKILELYEEQTNEYTNQYSGDTAEFFSKGTMSKINLSCMEEFDQYMSEIWMEIYYTAYDMDEFTAIQTAASACENYGSEGNAPGNLIDLRSFLTEASAIFADTDADEQILALLDENVDSVYGTGRHESQGLSMYYPNVSYVQNLKATYEAMLNLNGIAYTDDQVNQIVDTCIEYYFDGYVDNIDFIDGYYWYAAFLEVRFSNYWTAPAAVATQVQSNILPGYASQSTVNPQTSDIEYEIVTDDSGNITLTITSGQSSVISVEQNIVNYSGSDDLELFVYLGSRAVEADPNDPSVYQSGIPDEWVRFNDYVVPTFILESTEDHITYATPAEINDEWAYIVFGYDIATGEFSLQYCIRADSLANIANNDIFTLNDGDEVSMLFYIQGYSDIPGYEDFVSVRPIYEPFTYDSSCEFNIDTLHQSFDADNDYFIEIMNFLIKDSFGNIIATETIESVYDTSGNLISFGINTDYDGRYTNLYDAMST
ncbi:hypothetical protein SAMN05216413_1773 [Ruminococcaceae bacterium KH2T8]|nr:hypothetical protein SAMN05216413_1773 [Ruminococcaceae bacterium KH2T8]